MVVLLKPVFKSLFELVITNHHEPVYFNISHQESIAVSIKKQGKVSKEQHQVFFISSSNFEEELPATQKTTRRIGR